MNRVSSMPYALFGVFFRRSTSKFSVVFHGITGTRDRSRPGSTSQGTGRWELGMTMPSSHLPWKILKDCWMMVPYISIYGQWSLNFYRVTPSEHCPFFEQLIFNWQGLYLDDGRWKMMNKSNTEGELDRICVVSHKVSAGIGIRGSQSLLIIIYIYIFNITMVNCCEISWAVPSLSGTVVAFESISYRLLGLSSNWSVTIWVWTCLKIKHAPPKMMLNHHHHHHRHRHRPRPRPRPRRRRHRRHHHHHQHRHRHRHRHPHHHHRHRHRHRHHHHHHRHRHRHRPRRRRRRHHHHHHNHHHHHHHQHHHHHHHHHVHLHFHFHHHLHLYQHCSLWSIPHGQNPLTRSHGSKRVHV